MSHWPELPVNIIIKWLKDHSPSLVVADFGCGESLIGSIFTVTVKFTDCLFSVTCQLFVDIHLVATFCNFLRCIPGDARLAKNVKNKVFSFDLISKDPSVISCDMSNVCAFF